ncbi:transposase [Xenorhabdus sp. TS4]|nr:transposase [Xenorhabdus sp. TS4]
MAHHTNKITGKSERLSVLTDAEQEALYGLPDFNDAQRLQFLALTESELALANNRPSLHAQLYCILQIGYFKAKQAFFRFEWHEVSDDYAFVMNRYFHDESFGSELITKHERYTQREQITARSMRNKPLKKLALHWQSVDKLAVRVRRHLRPLYTGLDFACIDSASPWLKALIWAKDIFNKKQRFSQRPL